MARSTSRAAKPDKKSSAKSARTTDVEVVEESSGLGFDGGVALISILLLIVAFVLVDHELGAVGQGLFFKP